MNKNIFFLILLLVVMITSQASGQSALTQANSSGTETFVPIKGTGQAQNQTENWLQDETDDSENIEYAFFGDIGVFYVYTEGLVTSLYHLYGTVLDHFVDIYLTNTGTEPITMYVESEISGYSTPVSDTVVIYPNKAVEIHQNPRLNTEAIDQLNSQMPGYFTISFTELKEGGDDLILKESKEILIYSRRDVVWIEGFEWKEIKELYAAWVAPNDPAVEELIRKAADYTESGIITNGYGGVINDEDGSVWDRLQAVWKAEEEYHLTYISTMKAFSPGTRQRARTPYEVLSQSSGNCIELAILYASVAEALKLEAALIFIPGHAYVAIRTDQENAFYYFIETTLIGRADFSDAVAKGNENWKEHRPYVDAEVSGYGWVNIYEAREKGILPMPWR
jgi:hypothetical protein